MPYVFSSSMSRTRRKIKTAQTKHWTLNTPAKESLTAWLTRRERNAPVSQGQSGVVGAPPPHLEGFLIVRGWWRVGKKWRKWGERERKGRRPRGVLRASGVAARASTGGSAGGGGHPCGGTNATHRARGPKKVAGPPWGLDGVHFRRASANLLRSTWLTRPLHFTWLRPLCIQHSLLARPPTCPLARSRPHSHSCRKSATPASPPRRLAES